MENTEVLELLNKLTKKVDKLLNTLVNVIQIGTSDINNLLRGKLGNERLDTTIEYSSPNNFLDI